MQLIIQDLEVKIYVV